MRLVAGFSTPKRLDDPAPNEDAYGVSDDQRNAVVSDGASESYDSALWAKLLVSQFVQRPRFGRRWLESAVQLYSDKANRGSLPWYAEAALDRGSFATLLGVRFLSHSNCAVVLAIGDSLAVQVDEDRLLSSFPYTDCEQFKKRPLLLSTRRESNAWLEQEFRLRDHCTMWSFDNLKRPYLMLMTDALGAWLLDMPWQRTQRLVGIQTASEFVELVESERQNGSMRRDDTTLLVFA